MKPVSDDYITYILQKGIFSVADLFTITTADNVSDYFTSTDFDVPIDDITYKTDSLIIERLNYKISVGWTVDEQNIRILYRPDDELCGANFIEGVLSGLLDGATIKRQRAFWKRQEGLRARRDYEIESGSTLTPRPPLQVLTLFTGLVSTIDKIGQTSVELKVRSPMGLLDIDMPRNTYQSGCQWDLFSAGCTLDRDDFAFSGTVSSFSANGDWIEVLGIPTPTGADGDPWFNLGRLQFTSGDLNGLRVSLRTNDSTRIYFQFPPIEGIEIGNTFTAWPGCMKRSDSCDLKFSNLANFRGFPRVPPVMVSA